VTTPEHATRTLEQTSRAFAARGLESAWERVIGLVVQPGVEFGDAVVFGYDRAKAGNLSKSLPSHPELVYEAHSTDYQTAFALREMVEDHFAILKVGPWLTFALREAVFALAAMEREYLEGLSRVPEALEAAMLAHPAHWKAYYQGGERELHFARRYSFSDRSRYYWPEPAVRAELDRLVANLTAAPPPLTLLSQYLPVQYEAVREGTLRNLPGDLLRHRVRGVLETYAAACR
jgi:D-tagatose-1,6-bisphosphate aldolase subunit GatZ/KbaZ